MKPDNHSQADLTDRELVFSELLSKTLQESEQLTATETEQLSLCRQLAIRRAERQATPRFNYFFGWSHAWQKVAISLAVLCSVLVMFSNSDLLLNNDDSMTALPAEILEIDVGQDEIELLVNLDFYEQADIYKWLIVEEEGGYYES